jgi:hypothetical protein
MNKPLSRKHQISLVSLGVVIALIGITVFSYRTVSKSDTSHYIAQDVAQLATIFAKIDATAGILKFDHQKNNINFLNIKKDGFVGSELGSMNLIDPKKWDGPYQNQISKIQEEDYMVVRTKKGYFITPGDGVALPNGKIIGKDIILDENADIALMIQDDQALSYRGQPLAAHITISGDRTNNFQQIILPEDEE